MRRLQGTLCLQATASRRGVQYFQWCKASSRFVCCSGQLVASSSQQTLRVRWSTPEGKRGLPCSFGRSTRNGSYWRGLQSPGWHNNRANSKLNYRSFQRQQGRLGRLRRSSWCDWIPRDRPVLAGAVALSRVDNGSPRVERGRYFRSQVLQDEGPVLSARDDEVNFQRCVRR
jgi:hypothetical protein